MLCYVVIKRWKARELRSNRNTKGFRDLALEFSTYNYFYSSLYCNSMYVNKSGKKARTFWIIDWELIITILHTYSFLSVRKLLDIIPTYMKWLIMEMDKIKLFRDHPYITQSLLSGFMVWEWGQKKAILNYFQYKLGPGGGGSKKPKMWLSNRWMVPYQGLRL